MRTKRKMGIPDLNITALLDMFTMLLIFLLINFSAATSVNMKTSGFISFPNSSSDKKPVDVLTIVADKYNIILDGKIIAKHNNGVVSADDMDDTGFEIIPLYEAMVKYSNRTKFIATKNKTIKSEGKVILQMDKDLPFFLLRQIMYTAGQAEYNEFKFVALKKNGKKHNGS
jgi:biopolymer transport protein ExbD